MSREKNVDIFNDIERLCKENQSLRKAVATVVEQYKYDFQAIEFAVYCAPGQSENYDTFRRSLGK